MPRRLAALRNAVLVAAGFVVLRVVYRVVFGGAGGGGLVLLDLPRIPLAGPFSHIALLGEVTTGGLAAAASSALPFAGVIVGFGIVTVAVDVQALLTRGAVRGPVRTVSRALVVAWSTFPALLASVRRVLVARELRGERSAQSLLVPVLEQTVERAIALGASMEVRGFASRTSGRPEPVCEHPVVMRDASLGVDDRWILEGIDLALDPGTLVLVEGATGSGKSTLLHAMSGLFTHASGGVQHGVVEVAGVDRAPTPPRDTAAFVGVVAQSVRLSFVAATVHDEIGFALAVRGVAAAIVGARVVDTAERLGIAHLLDRETSALSAGEACLVAIGAALIAQPVLLLVDEPLADLDDTARARVVRVLGGLAHEAGVCVVVAEHALDDWIGVADARLALRDGRVHEVEVGAPSAPAGVAPHPAVGAARAAGAVARAAVVPPPRGAVAIVRGARVTHGDTVAVDDASLTLDAGEIVALRGPNGAGKSSLLHAIARPTAAGTVTVDGRDVRDLRRRARRTAVALVPEAFDDLLFATTVEAECRRADRRAPHGTRADTAATWFGLLGATGIPDGRDLLARHPRDLSAGERLCLVVAIQLSAAPRVLLVDEPTRGLDATARAQVGEALSRVAGSGRAVLVATHDAAFADRYAVRSVRMAHGRLDAPTPAVTA